MLINSTAVRPAKIPVSFPWYSYDDSFSFQVAIHAPSKVTKRYSISSIQANEAT